MEMSLTPEEDAGLLAAVRVVIDEIERGEFAEESS
jgi:hypothetical protein